MAQVKVNSLLFLSLASCGIVHSSSAWAGQPTPKDPLNLCTITINSSEEEAVMSRYLNQRTGFNKINLLDYAVPPQPLKGAALTAWNNGGWFKNACQKLEESGNNCDVLLISGHFANSFMGKAGLKLPLNDLEAARCRGGCESILGGKEKTKGPAEVFLMGCNTLATKKVVGRDRDVYYAALRGDEISDSAANWLVELRLGAVGKSYKERMTEAFAWVPHLYGFCDIAPAGNSVESSLEHYFKESGDYYSHVTQIQYKKALGVAGKTVKFCNGSLACKLEETNFKQCSGGGINGDILTDSSAESPLCTMLNDQNKLVDRIHAAGALTEKNNFLDYLPNLDPFLRTYSQASMKTTTRAAYDELMQKIEAGIKKNLKKFGTPDVQSKVVDVLIQRGVLRKGAAERIFTVSNAEG